MSFNPQVQTTAGSFSSFWFYFEVTGGVRGIDLSLGGKNAAITERVCSTVFDVHAGNNCSGGSGNLLGQVVASSNEETQTSVFSNTGRIYVFKDILVGSKTATGELTEFIQSFTSGSWGSGGSQIPEPASLFTMGSGLIAAGLLLKGRTRRP